MKKIKTITSYSGHFRYLATLKDRGWIVRRAEIRTPYSSGPTHRVSVDPRGRNVIICETAHKRYEVFEVPENVTIYRTDREATAAFVEQRRLEQLDA